MTDWAAVANMGTAGGTALLAVATFSSTRSANRAARNAERSMLEDLRPLLVPSRWQDPVQKVRFLDSRWLPVSGGHGVIDLAPDAVYLVMALRNVGRGLAVLDGWDVPEDPAAAPREQALFQRLTRDLSVPPGEQGVWQGAARGAEHPLFGRVTAGAAAGILPVDLLYDDSEGGQRMVSRLVFTRGRSEPEPSDAAAAGPEQWPLSSSRHWRLDGHDFRSDLPSQTEPARRRRLLRR